MNGASVHEYPYDKSERMSDLAGEISDGTDSGNRGSIIIGNVGIRLHYRNFLCRLIVKAGECY